MGSIKTKEEVSKNPEEEDDIEEIIEELELDES